MKNPDLSAKILLRKGNGRIHLTQMILVLENLYKIVGPLFGALAAPNKGIAILY